MPRSALLLGTALVGATLMAPAVLVGEWGLTPVNAAAGYYTRKKVNGRWITGKFPREPAAATPAVVGRGAEQAANSPADDGRPDMILVKRGTAARLSAPRRVRFVERKGVRVKARYAALPKYKPRVALRQAAAAPSLSSPPITVGSKAVEKPATASELASLPPDRVMATASIAPAPLPTSEVERMRPALEAKARAMALELVPFSVPLPDPVPPPALAARSVTFDLDKGLRTVVFADGTTVTVPFDSAKVPELTGLRPIASP